MRSLFSAFIGLTLVASSQAQALSSQNNSKAGPLNDSRPEYQSDSFANAEKNVATLWSSIPFFQGGDLGQYEETMSQSRDSVRKEFWNELMSEVEKLAEKGAVVEMMLEPMANILMMFDQVHDWHKAKDVINVDYSLEQQFKASLDSLFKRYDVRDDQRRLQISSGTNTALLQSYIQGISAQRPLGKKISAAELNNKMALEMFKQIDYVAYGTFSSLGRGQFQLTFHMANNKTGVTRNFISRGRLTEALDDLAQQVFDAFQKNVYEDWSTSNKGLQWLPMPMNYERQKQMQETGLYEAYTFSEAKTYCQARGYRLPYSREILMAESGTGYKKGGIDNLIPEARYAVADKRETGDNLWLTPGHGDSTGGPFMADGSLPMKGLFWCVKGTPSAEISFYEKMWSLMRQYRNRNIKVYAALETIRAEIGDFDAGDKLLFWNGSFVKIELLSGGSDEALAVLKKNGIKLEIPGYLKNP